MYESRKKSNNRNADFLEVFVIKKKIRQKTMQKTIRAVKIIL